MSIFNLEVDLVYGFAYNDCLWLENIVDSDNLYVTDRKFKLLVKKSIRILEEAEERKLKETKRKGNRRQKK